MRVEGWLRIVCLPRGVCGPGSRRRASGTERNHPAVRGCPVHGVRGDAGSAFVFIGRLCAMGYTVRLHMHAGVPACAVFRPEPEADRSCQRREAMIVLSRCVSSSSSMCVNSLSPSPSRPQREIVIYDHPNHRAFLFPSTASTFIISTPPS
jgi:hypothetical protein